METTASILNQMINQVNLNLKEKGFHLELNGCILDLVKGVNNMTELKINDYHERNMHHALEILNEFLVKKETSYFFIVVNNRNSMDLILIKYVDNPSCWGFVEKYILSTETPLKMGAEITKIHTLLFNIL